MFGELLFRGEDLVHISRAVPVDQRLPDGLRLVLAVLDGGQLHVLALAGRLPLGELGLGERRVGDELSPEDSLVLPVPQLEADVGPGVHHVVHLGRLADVRDLRNPVDWDVPLCVLADTNPHIAANHRPLEYREVDKLVYLEPRQSDLLQVFLALNSFSFLHDFVRFVSLGVRLSGGDARHGGRARTGAG